MATSTTPPLRAEPNLGAQQVCFAYADEQVLNGVDLNLWAGRSCAITGPSGSGKSTLLQVLAGILTPTSGVVRFEGRPYTEISARALTRLRLERYGFVFQFGELLPELTLQENVELPLLFSNTSRSDARASAREVLGEVGLAAQVDRFVSEVSGGQLQRAAVARALVHDPDVIFADEPTGALDALSASRVLGLLLDLAPARGAAVALVTHAADVADRCDAVVRLDGGCAVSLR